MENQSLYRDGAARNGVRGNTRSTELHAGSGARGTLVRVVRVREILPLYVNGAAHAGVEGNTQGPT